MCARQPILVSLPSSHDWDPCCPSCCPCTWSAWRRAWMGGPGSKDPRFFWVKGKHTHTQVARFFLASWLRCCHSCHSRSSSLGIHWVVLWQRWARWTWLRPSALGSEGWLTWRINGRLLSVWSVLWLLWSTYLIFLLLHFWASHITTHILCLGVMPVTLLAYLPMYVPGCRLAVHFSVSFI